uniref:EF-hand domain-containing protein n=1 Tax=Hemiselmis andersenii TaxID=464988 RepID=A0A6U4SN13_HEMAN|mmetsp:Transcript_32848/g.76700  ORF Transcript_32848/g.76700 Transcript_32848/m.76700 type:complete len:348 (+) Transcript_32848:39-1082(+)|eukprot:CAMPEP_0114131922 /NCGR_PEP_ID=MMETSP0043_2-20121206/12814_1 /TAXON_ID=464988 /ORGANISM="Hemiselmis andersenii, Strain CCMP644" /LENGTH=347 /DNA_ID=CAMNT_0001225391 /DNA_START=15 /DNA_END=1058 /DNA_ORIENTATION=-
MGSGSSKTVNPKVLAGLKEEFELADTHNRGWIDEVQFRTLLQRRATRTKVRRMTTEKQLMYSDVKAHDVMESKVHDYTQAKLINSLAKQAFQEQLGGGKQMTLEQLVKWQLNYDNDGVDAAEVVSGAKAALSSLSCANGVFWKKKKDPQTGETVKVEQDAAAAPLTNQQLAATRGEVGGPPPEEEEGARGRSVSAEQAPAMPSRATDGQRQSKSRTMEDVRELDKKSSRTESKLGRHTKSIRKINKLERTAEDHLLAPQNNRTASGGGKAGGKAIKASSTADDSTSLVRSLHGTPLHTPVGSHDGSMPVDMSQFQSAPAAMMRGRTPPGSPHVQQSGIPETTQVEAL